MKRISIFILILLLFECTKDKTPISPHENAWTMLPHSMKGWELYSWLNENKWEYSILTGTNRLKSYNEVISGDLVADSLDSLKLILNRLQEGEAITWLGRVWLERCWQKDYYNLSLPPEEILNEVKQYCNYHNLILEVVE